MGYRICCGSSMVSVNSLKAKSFSDDNSDSG